jgi:hypothetical protein
MGGNEKKERENPQGDSIFYMLLNGWNDPDNNFDMGKMGVGSHFEIFISILVDPPQI